MSNFQVHSVSELLRKFDINLGKTKVPDHSVLTCVLNLSGYIKLQNELTVTHNKKVTQPHTDQPTFRKYDVRNAPQDMLSSDIPAESLENIIYKLETEIISQREIDAIYTSLVDVIHTEMDNHLNYRDIRAGARKRESKTSKPWWTEELGVLWEKVRVSENVILKKWKQDFSKRFK